MTAEDGIAVLSTAKAADVPAQLKSSPNNDAAKQNGAVSHFATAETELVRVARSQQEPLAVPARAPLHRAAPAVVSAATNGAVGTSYAEHLDAQRLQEPEPPLRPQLLQRMQTLREALDAQSLKEPQRSAALRAFSMLCLACSPPAQSAASQVRR